MHRGAWPLTLKTRQQRKLAPIWMRSAIKNLRYRLKKKYFNGVPANEIRTTSPVDYMSNAQWRDLIAKWSDPKNMVRGSLHILFFANQF